MTKSSYPKYITTFVNLKIKVNAIIHNKLCLVSVKLLLWSHSRVLEAYVYKNAFYSSVCQVEEVLSKENPLSGPEFRYPEPKERHNPLSSRGSCGRWAGETGECLDAHRPASLGQTVETQTQRKPWLKVEGKDHHVRYLDHVHRQPLYMHTSSHTPKYVHTQTLWRNTHNS